MTENFFISEELKGKISKQDLSGKSDEKLKFFLNFNKVDESEVSVDLVSNLKTSEQLSFILKFDNTNMTTYLFEDLSTIALSVKHRGKVIKNFTRPELFDINVAQKIIKIDFPNQGEQE